MTKFPGLPGSNDAILERIQNEGAYLSCTERVKLLDAKFFQLTQKSPFLGVDRFLPTTVGI